MKRCQRTGKQILTKQMAKKVHVATGERADVDVYKCRFCKGFHIGHSKRPHRQQARLDQLFEKIKRKK